MRKGKVILYILLVVFVISIIYILFVFNKSQSLSIEISLNDSNITKKLNDVINNNFKIEYIDENEMKVGLYISEGSTKRLVSKYYCNFTAENIMGLFYALPTNEEVVSGGDFKQIFDEYYNKYENKDKYKFGYNIKFELKDGRIIDETVLNPDDAYYLFPKVQCYLYDDINLIPGRPYYHITQDIMTDDRICSSIKLVGDKETKNIISPIELTVFSFDGEDDFYPNTRKYRGNCSYKVLIYEK